MQSDLAIIYGQMLHAGKTIIIKYVLELLMPINTIIISNII
jgi:hypothetical protein